MELEHRALWALRQLNLDMEAAGTSRVTDLNVLDEFLYHDFESTRLYKERMRMMDDKNILERSFKPGDMVLLYNSIIKLFPDKLKSRWSGPFRVEMHSTTPIDITSKDGSRKFKVNGQRLKHYQGMVEEDKMISTLYLKDP
ncbi:PREDICTED: uncharacterized protein LOC109239068 [Nicotiana attenuata]|uniref:uncharacterized protein LOC109239068 n=1 Tax=Nicotiana attenuata TaxID=49451 RepID=UPI0009046ADF|nr:PREDICTED: uncharacterized protein LOC109239068 [Nicotiana attenuata]